MTKHCPQCGKPATPFLRLPPTPPPPTPPPERIPQHDIPWIVHLVVIAASCLAWWLGHGGTP